MTTTEKNERNDRLDAISKDLVELGTVWAKYGLSLGRQALEASAATLTKTASVLGQIADAVDGKKPEGEVKGAALPRKGAALSPMSDILPSRPGPHPDGLGQWLLATIAILVLTATVTMEWVRISGR